MKDDPGLWPENSTGAWERAHAPEPDVDLPDWSEVWPGVGANGQTDAEWRAWASPKRRAS